MDYGIQPFWFWNGDINECEVIRQIEEMYDKGVHGFVLCARQGLKVPYLSKRWFNLVKIAVEEAKKRKMEVWLYDEQPYPSGISGGRVVLDHPEYEAKEMRTYEIDYRGGEPLILDLEWGTPIYAKAFPKGEQILLEEGIDIKEQIGSLFSEEVYHEVGLTRYNRKRFLACGVYNQLYLELPEGDYQLIIFMEVPVRGHKYYDRFIDPLNTGAIKYFIETTHEQYKKYLGHEFGQTIKGIFTDEIHPFGYEGAGLPWSPLMPKLFKAATGLDLLEVMPALVRDVGEKTHYIRYEYMHVLVESFIASYDIQVQTWCHENALLYIGEKPILRSKQLKYMDIPGIDAGHQKAGTKADVLSNRYRANGKVLSSAAHFYHKERALCESFHSIGWGMEIQDMKWTYDWLLLQGVNMFVNHAYFYTTQALKKHDAPPSGFFQMPWWKHQGLLSDYIRPMSQFIKESEESVSLILLDPITSTWTQKDLESKNIIKMAFEEIQRTLFDHGINFYIMDQQLFAECTVKEGQLIYENEAFDYVVLPSMTNIEDKAFNKLEAYIQQGGNGFSVFTKPNEVIGSVTQEQLEQLFSNVNSGVIACQSAMSLVGELKNEGLQHIEVKLDGNKLQGLYGIKLRKDHETYYFIVNTTTTKGEMTVCDGKIVRCAMIGAFESLLLDSSGFSVFNHQNQEVDIDRLEGIQQFDINLDEDYDIHLSEKNVLRIHQWEMQIDEQEYVEKVTSKPIIDQLAMGGFSIPVQRQDQFGTPKTMLFTPIGVHYRSEIFVSEEVLEEPILLRIEKGGILGKWQLQVNEHIILDEQFYAKCSKTIKGDECDITNLLKIGENRISFRVECDKSSQGLLNPVYIIGSFLIKDTSEQSLLKQIPMRGRINDYFSNQIPYYAGDVGYKKMVISDGESDLYITINDSRFRQSATLKVNGIECGNKAFTPYIWKVKATDLVSGENEVVLTVATTLLGYYEGQYYDVTPRENDCYEDYPPLEQ